MAGEQPSPGAVLRRLGQAAWVSCLGLLIARWVPGDRFDVTAPICYAPALVAALPPLLLCAAFAGRARRRAFTASLLLGGLAFMQEQPRLLPIPDPAPPPHGRPIKVLLLNVQSYRRGPKVVAGAIRAERPDVIALLESTSWGRVLPGFRQEMGDEYRWTSMRYLALGTRQPIESAESVPLPHDAFAARAVLDWEGRRMALWLIDMPTPPFRKGAEIYAELRPLLESEELPVLVVGDMNTPRQSPLLRRTFRTFEDATQAPGAPRWLATWPSGFPAWQIDHARTRGLVPTSTHFVEGVSDHLGIVVEVALPSLSAGP